MTSKSDMKNWNLAAQAMCCVQLFVMGVMTTALLATSADAAKQRSTWSQKSYLQPMKPVPGTRSAHVFRCMQLYRTYDRHTDTYLHYTGVRKKCRY